MKGGLSRRKVRGLLATGLISACCFVTAFAVKGYNRATPTVAEELTSSPVIQSATPPVPPSGGTLARLDVEVITIRPTGFERAQITRPKGLFGIAVENRSGLTDIALRLDQEGGSRLNQVQLSKEQPNWKLGLDLPPGRYVLTEASNPNWVCQVTITEN